MKNQRDLRSDPHNYLVSLRRESRVPLGQDALHPDVKDPFDFDVAVRVRRRQSTGRRVVTAQHRRHLLVVVLVYVLVDAVTRELDLAQSQVHARGLAYVHDLAVGCHHEYETVERLKAKLNRYHQLLDD